MPDGQELSLSELARRLAQRPRKPRQVRQHTCAVCGKVFESPRVTRRYCSQRCNQQAYLARQRGTAASVEQREVDN